MRIIQLCYHNTGASSTLTIKEGMNLVGKHCPGTVRLFCEGVELTLLRWKYNENNEIVSYDPRATPNYSNLLGVSAFRNVELFSVAQNPGNARFANFTSILTIDLTGLQEIGVTNITCGDPVYTDTLYTEVKIIEQSYPEMINITKVIASYVHNSSLESLDLTWKKIVSNFKFFPIKSHSFSLLQIPACPQYESSLGYQLNITGLGVVRINQTSCENNSCTAEVMNFVDTDSDYQILFIMNETNSNERVLEIGKHHPAAELIIIGSLVFID